MPPRVGFTTKLLHLMERLPAINICDTVQIPVLFARIAVFPRKPEDVPSLWSVQEHPPLTRGVGVRMNRALVKKT